MISMGMISLNIIFEDVGLILIFANVDYFQYHMSWSTTYLRVIFIRKGLDD